MNKFFLTKTLFLQSHLCISNSFSFFNETIMPPTKQRYLNHGRLISRVKTEKFKFNRQIKKLKILSYGALKMWASVSSQVHICATEYQQLITCLNKCSSQSCVLFSLQQHTACYLQLSQSLADVFCFKSNFSRIKIKFNLPKYVRFCSFGCCSLLISCRTKIGFPKKMKRALKLLVMQRRQKR